MGQSMQTFVGLAACCQIALTMMEYETQNMYVKKKEGWKILGRVIQRRIFFILKFDLKYFFT